ncbi:squalene/phytoene synthase family protein, partial [Streptomyces sp. NPDC059569]|uniref:squalene/phytoene synthase family protein n=1 Tax=Streptomyces sp. NPDC059569 TaxID=3346869 RepID=UPI0036A6AF0B
MTGPPGVRSDASSRTTLDKAADENFPVAPFFLPRAWRDDLMAVYGFARLVDDIGDGDLAPGGGGAPPPAGGAPPPPARRGGGPAPAPPQRGGGEPP